MNKYQDSLDALALCTTEVEDDTDVGIIQELIDKAEKYRWHDLRKNPDDLPEEYWLHKVLIFEEYLGYNDDGEDVMRNTHTICGYMDGRFLSNGRKQKTLAWRYIEPFEEEENDRTRNQ